MFGFAELTEQLAGIERWASDLRVRAHRLLGDSHTPCQVHVIADEYAALADERDAAAECWERSEPAEAGLQAAQLRRLSTADRERCAYYRARAADGCTTSSARVQPDATAGLVPHQAARPRLA